MIQDIKLPEISENVVSGEVAKLLVAVGDLVKVDQSLIELETDKAVVEVPSTHTGRVMEILVKVGDTVRVGETIVRVETEAEEELPRSLESIVPSVPAENVPEQATVETAPAPSLKKPAAAAVEPASLRSSAPASPSVRRLARELGVDIDQVKGSGADGRISLEDVKAHAKQMVVDVKAPIFAGIAPLQLPDFSRWGEIERVPMSKVRKITAEGLSAGWAAIPQVTQNDKADITAMEQFRKQVGRQVEAKGGKLTVTVILLKVVCQALKQFPQFNASVDIANSEIIHKHYYHIGVAVDTDRGLLVPVVKDVDRKGLTDLAIELNDLAERTRNRKVKPEELEGGNITISNLGGIGGTSFSPIVYAPQVAILGVSRAALEPVYMDGQWQPRLMLPLSLTYDHRQIDGADGARFVRWIAQTLEQPLMMWL